MTEIEGRNGGRLTPFQPGQSGNPGGLSKELRAQIAENAERATRIRAAALARVEALIDADGVLCGDIDANILKLLKDSEDRGLGAPKTTAEVSGPEGAPLLDGGITVNFVRAAANPDT